MSNQQHAKELHKLIIRKFKKEKYTLHLKTISEGVDLDDMQLISKYNKEIRYLLCVIDFLSKCAWVVPLKYKKGVTIANSSQSILQKENQTKYG